MNCKFEINPEFKITKIQLQGDDNFVLVIDDLMLNPSEIVHFAKHVAYFDPVGADGTYYPGVRDVMPLPYARALHKVVEPIIAREYFDSASLVSMSPVCKLSLITLAADELRDEQRIPHVDSASENEFAMVHYLCSESHGGTSLYRYKPTGQVKIVEDSAGSMREMVEAAKATAAEHNGYLTGTTSLFERVGKVEAKFNRLVLYKSNLLHCADVEGSASCQRDVEKGRLSVASFMYFEES